MADILEFKKPTTGKGRVLDYVETGYSSFSVKPTFIPTSGEDSHWAMGEYDTKTLLDEINEPWSPK